ncbi:DUF1697 domain-containing protein [Salinibacterium sp.]|uniref:DUF1697 domain-containing protein n=1 Tax=Salinibacterium sp. TaxID=1915057 RepID=UPI00286B4214|nr:DUF1697 domain-containing protein [Salinibacterium sp.]
MSSSGRSVALLRGINVGPTTKVPMALLHTLFADSGATEVTTVLNSGNVVFSGTVDAAALARRVATETGVSTSILVIDAARFRRIAAAFPFPGDESRLTVTFMAEVPTAVSIPIQLGSEQIRIGTEAVYQSIPDGISKTRLTPAFWRQFGREATARNLRTVTKLLALLE